MNAPHACPKCGATLPADAPEGLCPACLMVGGFATDATIKLTPSQMRPASQPAAAPTPQELAPLFPQLEIIELLGRGGMGAVYKARQPKLNRFVALKIIAGDAAADPHFAERFQREAQALAKLNHPNIVSVFDFGETGGLFYFLMEYVDGANLRAMMQSGEMKPGAALALIPAFCDALQYAHDEGVVHRDIKPENVLVDKKGRVKIADFGLAKLLGHDAPGDTLTRTGMYLGTPRYMAPEQVEKPETVDHRADIYSLGVVFYEMLTGELPLGRFDPPSKKVQVDVKLDEIVLHALEKEPARRYQHASEIKTDVEGVRREKSAITPHARLRAAEADAGVLFKIQTLPRCGRDLLMSLLTAPVIVVVFLLLPGGLAWLLANLLGAEAARAWMIAAFAGGVAFFGTFALLCAGSVASVRVRARGLAINRNVGPSRFIPWAAIRSIEPMSFGEVAKEIAIWPGFPPRGSIVCQAAEGYLRINTDGGCWYFNPRDPGAFFEAVERAGMPGGEMNWRGIQPEGETSSARTAAGWPAYALLFAAFHLAVFGLVVGGISATHGAASLPSPSPLGGTQAQWAVALFAAGAMVLVGALQMLRLKSYALALVAAVIATVPLALLYSPHGFSTLRHVSPMVGIWALITLLRPKIRAAFGVVSSRPVATPENPHLSRMALIAAIWGLFGLIAVIPSVLFKKMVDLAEGKPSSLVYEQPPLAFAIFMGVLLFIGMGAPIGTTILGAISMSNIKKSGGRLYGLPLAFADTVFFPLLLVHGAMAVLLGLLIVTIMKMAGVNAGLGAAEMGLLAMLPLIADFFIVRALWRKVAGTVGTAATPLPASAASNPLRNWVLWFGTGVIFVIAFVATFLLQDSTGTGGKGLSGLFGSSGPLIVAEKIDTRETNHYRFRYKITTPPDHRVLVWMETTREGRPVVIPGLANNISSSLQLPIGEAFEGYAEFSLVEGSRLTPTSDGKWRWDFKFGSTSARVSPGGWIENPFAGMSTSTYRGPERWQPKPGETVSILVLRGDDESVHNDPTVEPPSGKIEFRLKARIDPVPLFHRVQGTVASSLRDPFPTPATPLGQIAAGFKINPKLPDDEICRQMIEALRSNDAKRLNAEMILKSVGKPITRETKPEDVLKALEAVATAAAPPGNAAPGTKPDETASSTHSGRGFLSAEQIRVEHTALKLLAAMRDKDDKTLREMASDQIKAWPDALPMFALELREKHQHAFDKPLALWPAESLVEGGFAVVRCAPKETMPEMNEWYLGLFFIKSKDGAWRNASLRGTSLNKSLPELLAEFKSKDLPDRPAPK